MTQETFSKCKLFGGAMTCEIPSAWRDVSDQRQVPSHQEVFQEISVAHSSMNAPGRILVVEILERSPQTSDAKIAEFLFQDLAEANEVRCETIFQSLDSGSSVDVQVCESTCVAPIHVASGIGIQKIAPGREIDVTGNPRVLVYQWVVIELCVVRLAHVDTELLITLSTPSDSYDKIEPPSSFSNTFRHVAESFRIVDWSLFGA